jgi:hypothetical protein
MAGIEGASMASVEGTGYRWLKRGKWRRLMAEWRGIDAAIFFSSGGGIGVDRGGGARLAGGAVCTWLRCGRKKKVAGWAVRVGWAGREAEAQWGGGGGEKRPVEKKNNGLWLGRKAGWAESDGKILFRIKFDFWIFQGFGNLHKEI